MGKYSRAVKRCDDGNKLTTDLVSMISERAELEKTFSKMLKSWSKKWSDYVAKCKFLTFFVKLNFLSFLLSIRIWFNDISLESNNG
jgi:hypothetical protein